MLRPRVALVCAALLATAACGGTSDGPAEPDDARGSLPEGADVITEAVEARFGTGDAGFDGYRIRYEIEGVDGDPVEVTGIVGVPAGDPPAGGWPLVAIAHGTTGIADACAPSATDDLGGLLGVLASTVAGGVVVAYTDYEGLGGPGTHPYLQASSEARSITGAVTAATELLPDQVQSRWVAYGYSQGGHATLALAELGPGAVPDLELAGVVAVAPPFDLRRLVFGGESDIAGGVAALFAAGVLGDDGDGADLLTDAGVEAVDLAGASCVADVVGAVPSPEPLFRPGETDPGTPLGDALDDNSVGTEPTDVPILVAQGDADTTIAIASVEDGVEHLCALGAPVQLLTYPGATHATVLGASGADAANWMLQRLAGAAPTPTC